MAITKEGMAWVGSTDDNVIKFYINRFDLSDGGRSEHLPPHVHGKVKQDGGYNAEFAISDGHKIKGDFPRNLRREAEKWVAEHSEELQKMWDTQDFHPVAEARRIGGRTYRQPWQVVSHKMTDDGIYLSFADGSECVATFDDLFGMAPDLADAVIRGLDVSSYVIGECDDLEWPDGTEIALDYVWDTVAHGRVWDPQEDLRDWYRRCVDGWSYND